MKWTKEEVEILRYNYPIMPNKEVHKFFRNRKWYQIKNKVNQLGLKKKYASWYWKCVPLHIGDLVKGYLAGFLDADGWISLRNTKGKRMTFPEVGFGNTNPLSIQFIRNVLEKVGIEAKYYIQHKSPPRLPLHSVKIYRYQSIYRLLITLKGILKNRRKEAETVLKFLDERAKHP